VWALFAIAAAAPLDASQQGALDRLHGEVERIRQVRFRVPEARRMSVDELYQHEVESLEEWMTPEDWRNASWSLVAFDLAPPGFDLQSALTVLLGQGVQGFYDPDEHELVVVDRDGGLPFRQVAGHELSHAQQMTRFEAWPTRVPGLRNDDLVSAFDGLLEGEAMLVELALLDHDPLNTDLRAQLPGFWPGSPRLSQPGVPSAVLESVSYAYTLGAEFAQELLRDGGWGAFDRAFDRPPLSTEQVLHPEKYLSRDPDLPQRVRLDVRRWLPDHHLVDENSVGELGIVTMLRQWGQRDDAWAVGEGWDGDRAQVFLRDGQVVLVWRLVWDTESDAGRFVRALRARWGAEPDFAIERRDREVVALRGVPNDLHERLFDGAWRRRPRTVRRVRSLIDRGALRRWRREQRRDP